MERNESRIQGRSSREKTYLVARFFSSF